MITLKQPKPCDVENITLDYLIVASGFECRALLQAEKYHKKAKVKIALGFNIEMNDKQRKNNDKKLLDLGFDIKVHDNEEATHIYLNSLVFKIEKELTSNASIMIYIDYSCMTKNWYSYFIFSLSSIKNRNKLTLYFGYSHAKFASNKEDNSLNRIVKPLFGYCNLNVPAKPTALLIGMGNEPNRIYGLKEYFDAVPYLFYSDKSYNEKYGNEIEDVNSDIINKAKIENIFRLPISDLIYSSYILENLCVKLLRDYRIVIAPCGPKPFALISMIIALKHNDFIEVWRISAGDNISKIDRKPTGKITILELQFTPLVED